MIDSRGRARRDVIGSPRQESDGPWHERCHGRNSMGSVARIVEGWQCREAQEVDCIVWVVHCGVVSSTDGGGEAVLVEPGVGRSPPRRSAIFGNRCSGSVFFRGGERQLIDGPRSLLGGFFGFGFLDRTERRVRVRARASPAGPRQQRLGALGRGVVVRGVVVRGHCGPVGATLVQGGKRRHGET